MNQSFLEQESKRANKKNMKLYDVGVKSPSIAP